MAWEGYRSRLCKCNDFNVYGLFGRDTLQSRQKQTGRETQVVILNRLRKRIHQVAKKRNCSMNQLVNSALLAFYSKGGESKLKKPAKGRGSSMHSYDTMSEPERRELHQMLYGLSAMQSVSIDAE